MNCTGLWKLLNYNLNRLCYILFRYGSQAGLLTENGLYAIGNAALAVNNVDNLGIKAVAKRAAKDTGKALLTDVKDRKKGNVTANIDSVSYSKKQ